MPRLPRSRDALAVIVVCLAAACGPTGSRTTPSSAPPRPGLELRLASFEPCLACETLRQRDPAASPLHLKRRPILTSADIQSITRSTDPISDLPAIDFKFRPEARARIQQASSAQVGGLIAWVADGQAFYVSRLSGTFSDTMSVTGMETGERNALFDLLIRADPSPATATP
jgi:preprotein translocase subunit SecD